MNKFLIKNPIITEKATRMSPMGKYVFLVEKGATKPEIKKAVEGIYKVKVEDMQVINTRPKPIKGRFIGVKPGYRKAIVTLKAGQKLDVLPH